MCDTSGAQYQYSLLVFLASRTLMLVFLIRLRQRLVYSGHGGRAAKYTLVPTNWLPLKKVPAGFAGSGTLITRLAGQLNPFGLARLGSFRKKLYAFRC
jgi:hypothetical protein